MLIINKDYKIRLSLIVSIIEKKHGRLKIIEIQAKFKNVIII